MTSGSQQVVNQNQSIKRFNKIINEIV